MNGSGEDVADAGAGIEMGRLGLEVGSVGSGGRLRMELVRPGIWATTTFWIAVLFCKLFQLYKWRRIMLETYFDL